MTVRAIFAADNAWGIGKAGTLPWPKNSADLRWFRECTEGNIVMMGRRTWQDAALPKPLPNRYNIVVSDRGLESQDTRPNIVIPRNLVKSYLDSIDRDIWVIGGAQLLNSVIDNIEELWISRIQGTYNCDTHISFDSNKFILFERLSYFDSRLFIEKYKRQ